MAVRMSRRARCSRFGDDFTIDLSAESGGFWTVESAYSSSFPLTFAVEESATRDATILTELFLDGVLVATVENGAASQSYVHVGAAILEPGRWLGVSTRSR